MHSLPNDACVFPLKFTNVKQQGLLVEVVALQWLGKSSLQKILGFYISTWGLYLDARLFLFVSLFS